MLVAGSCLDSLRGFVRLVLQPHTALPTTARSGAAWLDLPALRQQSSRTAVRGMRTSSATAGLRRSSRPPWLAGMRPRVSPRGDCARLTGPNPEFGAEKNGIWLNSEP